MEKYEILTAKSGVEREISPVDTAHRELETSAAGPGLGLHLGLATFSTAGHCEVRLGFISETQKL